MVAVYSEFTVFGEEQDEAEHVGHKNTWNVLFLGVDVKLKSLSFCLALSEKAC